MRRRLALIPLFALWTAWAGVFATPAGAQEPTDVDPAAIAAAEAPDPSVALDADPRGYQELINLWRNRAAALPDDPERAAEQFDRVVRAAQAAGIRRLDAFAVALLREAAVAAEADRIPRANALVDRAEMLAPGLPEVFDMRASVALDEAPWALHRWTTQRAKGLLARIDDFQRRVLLLGDVVLVGLLILGLLATLFMITQCVRYAVHVFHDLGQAFPSTMRFVLLAAVLLVLALPLIYGFGPLLLAFPLAGVLWAYQSRGERILSVLTVVVLGLSPWLLRMGDRLTEAGTGISQALHALALNPGDTRALETVQAATVAAPRLWQAQAVLGLAYTRLGRLDEAADALTAAAGAAEDDEFAEASVLNNLGNVRFAQGRPKAAEDAYNKARRRAREAAQPHFNLHRLYRRLGRSDDAEQAIQQASAVDAQAVAAWSQDEEPTVNRYVVDMPLPTTTLTRLAMADLFADTPFARRAWVVLAGPVPEMTAPFAALATLIVFGVLARLRPRMRLTWPCMRCARPAPSNLAGGPPDHPQCEQCVNLFVRNIPVDRRVRYQKEQTVARFSAFRRWGTRALGLFVPGTVDLVRGQALRGAAFVGLSVVLAVLIIWPDGLLLEPVPDAGADPDAIPIARILPIAALALLWLGHVVRAARWKERL